jgi:hypothetical protein
LEHDLDATIQYWMALVQKDAKLTCIRLNFKDRMRRKSPCSRAAMEISAFVAIGNRKR